MNRVSIANACVPSQEHTRQGFPAPNQFGPGDWSWNIGRQYQNDWNGNEQNNGNLNYFAKNEGYQQVKTAMFNPLTGEEPVYGHMNYVLSPLDQEQTNSHTSAYTLMGQTRVAGNMNPVGVMRAPTYTYPVNGPPNLWARVYQGSTARAPMAM